MKIEIFTVVALLLTLVSGCSDGSSGSSASKASTNPAKTLTQEDFNVSGTNFNAEDFIGFFYSRDDFFDRLSAESNITASSATVRSQCRDYYLSKEQYKTADDGSFYIDLLGLDLSACYGNTITVTSDIYEHKLVVKDYNNKSLDINDPADINNANIKSVQYRTLYIDTLHADTEKLKFDQKIIQLRSGYKDFNAPCTKIEGSLLCSSYEVENLSSEQLSYTLVTQFDKNVTSVGGLYFASGSIHFKLNNWSGEITYVDATTPPTFKASDGKTVVEGTLFQEPNKSEAP